MNTDARTSYYAAGGAALDLYTSTRRLPKKPELPEEQRELPQRRKKIRVKAKVAVAPFTVAGFCAVIVMMVLVIFGYVQLYEASSHNADLKDELSALKEENAAYVNQYESQIDLSHVEDVAIQELGMHKTLADQTVYLDLSSAEDKGVVLSTDGKPGVLRRAYETVRDSLSSLLEYLS